MEYGVPTTAPGSGEVVKKSNGGGVKVSGRVAEAVAPVESTTVKLNM
jgi:hypothetical protein